jgi:hypothetical protein
VGGGREAWLQSKWRPRPVRLTANDLRRTGIHTLWRFTPLDSARVAIRCTQVAATSLLGAPRLLRVSKTEKLISEFSHAQSLLQEHIPSPIP